MQTIKTSTIYNCDCMELMKQYSDNHFDLAIVDPPYGIGMGGGKIGNSKKDYKQFAGSDNEIPKQEYFDELFRVSKEQIIWGGNYFIEQIKKNSQCWIIWNKIQREFTMSDAELAWASFDKTVRCFDMSRGGAMGDHNNNGGKMHPTQKPVKLYEWLLTNYAKQGDKILDTHLGSGSHAIACNNMGFELTACELDKDYYEASIERIKREAQQERLF